MNAKKITSKILIPIVALIICISSTVQGSFGVVGSQGKPAISVKAHNNKNEAKNVLSRFTKSMLLVAGSCLAIYLVLLGYKRLKGAKLINTQQVEISKNLTSPETIEEATKLFIEKF